MSTISELHVSLECQIDDSAMRSRAERLGIDIDVMSDEELAGFAHDTIWEHSSAFMDLWGVEVMYVTRDEDDDDDKGCAK